MQQGYQTTDLLRQQKTNGKKFQRSERGWCVWIHTTRKSGLEPLMQTGKLKNYFCKNYVGGIHVWTWFTNEIWLIRKLGEFLFHCFPAGRHPSPALGPKASKLSWASASSGRILGTESSEMAQAKRAGLRQESGSAFSVFLLQS